MASTFSRLQLFVCFVSFCVLGGVNVFSRVISSVAVHFLAIFCFLLRLNHRALPPSRCVAGQIYTIFHFPRRLAPVDFPHSWTITEMHIRRGCDSFVTVRRSVCILPLHVSGKRPYVGSSIYTIFPLDQEESQLIRTIMLQMELDSNIQG